MLITDCFKWHVEGNVLEKDVNPIKAPENYFEKSKKILLLKKNQPKKQKKLRNKQKERLKELVKLDIISDDDVTTKNETDSEYFESENEQNKQEKLKDNQKKDSQNSDIKKFKQQMDIYKTLIDNLLNSPILIKLGMILLFISVMLKTFGY